MRERGYDGEQGVGRGTKERRPIDLVNLHREKKRERERQTVRCAPLAPFVPSSFGALASQRRNFIRFSRPLLSLRSPSLYLSIEEGTGQVENSGWRRLGRVLPLR